MIRLAQLLLCVSALGLWVASRLPWVSLGSADGLGHPKTNTITGAAWSTALTPLAVLLLAAALAGLAGRGWLLRALAILVATVCVLLAYLGVSLMVMPDVAPRGAELADVPVMDGARDDAARRFVNLVDEFYDRSVKLVISAEAPPAGRQLLPPLPMPPAAVH